MPGPDKLDVEGDTSAVGIRWERWKRSLLIYLEAADIQIPEKKRATLLHFGGPSLQDIYSNLPGANAVTSVPARAAPPGESDTAAESQDVFEIALKKLDEYFLPKQSKVYERHLFRQLKQETGEKMEKFLVRLRNQAGKCGFEKPDNFIIDQITEKCTSHELRKKILTMGDKATLDEIMTLANTLELVSHQLDVYGKEENGAKNHEVNQIVNKSFRKDQSYNNEARASSQNISRCTRCGSKFHKSTDLNCSAKNKTCHSCKKIGHFSAQCKSRNFETKPQKRKYSRDQNSSAYTENGKRLRNRKGNYVDMVDGEEADYVFQINNDSTITCMIGGVKIDMLIDSGCKPNLITDKTWERLKSEGIKINNQIKDPRKILLAYGSQSPLTVKGSFDAEIKTNDRKDYTTFYVISGGTRDLLGKTSALKLGVLRIGIGINQVDNLTTTPFPKFKNVLVEIPIDDSVKPISQPCRRVPIPLERKVDDKIKELLDQDIIEEVEGSSRWVSPIVPILKENGELRLCVDMRRANNAIMRENHPLPTMDKLLPKINKAKFFTKLDVKNAFHQVEIHPDSRHITTFITPNGLYRYKRLMFGITCAPELFQKILERMLIQCGGVINFIDDILVYGDNEQEHDTRLNKVLQTLKDNNVLLNEAKCIFKTQSVDFLGHHLEPNGITPLNKYVKSIMDFRVPKTIEELQSFLGLLNYINKWIPNLATRSEPLKELLRMKLGKNANIEKFWLIEQRKSFENLKQMLTKIQSLGYYDVRDKTQVIADASPVGLGAILVQIDGNGPRIIAFGNRTLTDCERRYSQTEKEALALVWGVEHFNIFLFGKEFDLVTDHKPLEVLFGKKSKPCARIERWVLRLQSYKYRIIYKPGKNNIADPLSRLCKLNNKHSDEEDTHVCQVVTFARPQAISMSDIINASETDKEICNVRKGLYQNNWDDSVRSYKFFENELCFYDNILLRGNKIVIPHLLRKSVLDAAHEGHPGIVAMKGRLRSKVWWPRIDKDAENLVKSCKGCTLVALPTPPVPMKRRELPLGPWIDVAMDLLGPLPSNEYLLVIIDYYSRYKEIKVTKSISSAQIINILKEIFSRLGFPVSITADNGKQFVSEDFREYCKECNIRLFNTVPYWPQMNGEVERQNRDILKRLRISQTEQRDIKDSLYEYLMMYNSTPHSVTGRTPSELFFQRQNRDKIPTLENTNEKKEDLEVRDRDKIQKELGKEYGDRKRKAMQSVISEGEKVYVKALDRANKLTPNFNPTQYTVESSKAGDCVVRNDETGQSYRRNVVHLKKVEGEWKAVVPEKENEEVEGGSDD